ncbi:unnamed protein product [Macrosiphum euphorbiae]|uniref:Uncharacterized protein n=1 Tax=Macrosiphum euphorbiae TaxID=13131 RepID=A0AAV0WNG0_9HEMI|nr:unnamed protein product [Macrosiphum euphorbiae]
MEQKSGPILSDNLSTLIESRSTTEWLPRNLNYESDTSSSSKTQNPVNFDFDNVVADPVSTENSMDFMPLSIEKQNTPNTVEVLEVGMEGVRPKRKINIREITKLEKSRGVGKKLQPNPCANKKCQNKCSEKFSENDRKIIFSACWKLADPIRQKDYILNCVNEMPIKRQRVIVSSKRNVTKEYSLPFENYRKKVCLQYVLSTLNITKKFLNYTINNELSPTTSKIDQRGRHSPKHKKSYDIMRSIEDFTQKLPAIKSHYCRASTFKKYLPAEMGNLSRLYQVYKCYCAQKKIEIVKNSLF